MKIAIIGMAMFQCILGCVGPSAPMNWTAVEPTRTYRGTGIPASVKVVDGVKFYIHRTKPTIDWELKGYLIQHNYHSKEDVAEAIKEHGGDIAIRGTMLGRAGAWAVQWAIGKQSHQIIQQIPQQLSVELKKTKKQLEAELKLFSRFRLAAEDGNPDAQAGLGLLYDIGEGVEKNDSEAVKWWRKASEQGHALAQFFLGERYRIGQGVERNDDEAFKWYKKSAVQGNAHAQLNLGKMLNSGRGVDKDQKEAIAWYRQAAEQGLAHAQASVALAYYQGDGVLEDSVASYAWFNVASANGYDNAKKFKVILAKEMTSDQIAMAQKLSRELSRKIEAKNQSSPIQEGFPFAPRIDPQTGLPISNTRK